MRARRSIPARSDSRRGGDRRPDAKRETLLAVRRLDLDLRVVGSLANVVRIQPPSILTEDQATEVTDNSTPMLKEVNQGL